MADCSRLLAAMDVAGALDLEAFAANLSIIDPAVAAAKPLVGHRHANERLRELLTGSSLWKMRKPENPMTATIKPIAIAVISSKAEKARRLDWLRSVLINFVPALRMPNQRRAALAAAANAPIR